MPAKSKAAKQTKTTKSAKSASAKSAKSAASTKSAKAASPTKKAASPTKKAASPTKKPASPTKKARAASDPLATVKPLIRVRQIRDFTSKRVTKAELDAIAEVARWSGSSRNEQPCRFIALRDKNTITEIAELGLPQTRGLPTATAAIAIAVPDEPERELSRAFDDGRAAERILIAANLLGMAGGISRVRPDVREPINKRLELPTNRSVRTIVAIGYPSTEALAPKSEPGAARLPRELVVYEGRWPSTE